MSYGACQWGILMIMTKLVPVELVGLFILSIAIISPIQMFTNLQLRAVLVTDSKQKFYFSHYLTLRLLTSIFTVIVAILIALVLKKGYQLLLLMIVVGLFKFADSMADVTYGLEQKRERLDMVAISRIMRGVIGVPAFAACLFFSKNVVASLFCLSLAWLAVFFLYDIPNCRKTEKIRLYFDYNKLKELCLVAFPLGISMAMISLNTNIPRYFSEKYLGTVKLGYFGTLSYLVVILGTAVSSIGQAAVARLSKYYIDNLRAYILLLLKMIGVAAFLGLLGILFGILFGKQLLGIVYTEEYAQYKSLFIWLLLAGGIGYISSMLGFGLTSARLFKSQVPLISIVTVSLLISSNILIPKFGIIGAAWSVLAGMLTQGVCATIILIYFLSKRRKT
jgi:O-antigen/teichoic acid export membrane protein